MIHAGRGHVVPAGTTPTTVAAAARALSWDVAEALRLAGFNPDRYEHLQQPPSSDQVPGFGQLTDRQRAAVIELVTSILDSDDATLDGPVPVRTGRAPTDLLDRPDVKVWSGDSGASDRASSDR